MTKQEVLAFIQKQNAVVVGSVDEDGWPNQKAMFPPRKAEGENVFWLSTNTSSLHVKQFRANPRASLYFFKREAVRCTGVMLKGSMEVLEDEASKRALWRPGDVLYYPKGVTDPDYCVLRFTAACARVYRDLKKEDFTFGG